MSVLKGNNVLDALAPNVDSLFPEFLVFPQLG
jgi:hypothetical protein